MKKKCAQTKLKERFSLSKKNCQGVITFETRNITCPDNTLKNTSSEDYVFRSENVILPLFVTGSKCLQTYFNRNVFREINPYVNCTEKLVFPAQTVREAGAQCSYMSTSTTFSRACPPGNRQLSMYICTLPPVKIT
jgi:hypothetical protein